MGTLVVLAVVLGVAVLRFEPVARASNGGVLEGDIEEIRIGAEPARLVAAHEPGAEFVLFESIRNTQNLPITLRGVRLAGPTEDALYGLVETDVLRGRVARRDIGDAERHPVDGFRLGGGESATLVLRFEHLEPCVDIAADAPDIVTEVVVEFEVFGFGRDDEVRLRRGVAISADGGWQATDSDCAAAPE